MFHVSTRFILFVSCLSLSRLFLISLGAECFAKNSKSFILICFGMSGCIEITPVLLPLTPQLNIRTSWQYRYFYLKYYLHGGRLAIEIDSSWRNSFARFKYLIRVWWPYIKSTLNFVRYF